MNIRQRLQKLEKSLNIPASIDFVRAAVADRLRANPLLAKKLRVFLDTHPERPLSEQSRRELSEALIDGPYRRVF